MSTGHERPIRPYSRCTVFCLLQLEVEVHSAHILKHRCIHRPTQHARPDATSTQQTQVSWKFHVGTIHGTSWNHPTIQRCKSKFDLSLSDLNHPPSNLKVFIICHNLSYLLIISLLSPHARRNTSQTPWQSWHISAEVLPELVQSRPAVPIREKASGKAESAEGAKHRKLRGCKNRSKSF